MKPLKPRDKVTQRMTRAGLTLDNQTTGESMNISSREAEPEYTAKPDGTAEKALERAVDIRDRHKAKQAARHGERMAKEASGPASRLQFTAEERPPRNWPRISNRRRNGPTGWIQQKRPPEQARDYQGNRLQRSQGKGQKQTSL